MSGEIYRLTSSVSAIRKGSGTAAYMMRIPSGALVSEAPEQDKPGMMHVIWNGESFYVAPADLQECAVRIRTA